MTTLAEDELTMPGSPDIYLEIVRTLPLIPANVELDFYADGIKRSYHDSPIQTEQYVIQCRERGIIPFSELKLKYDCDWGVLLPSFGLYDNILSLDKSRTWEQIKEARSSLLSGRKINKVGIVSDRINENDFREIKDLAEELVSKGYTLLGGDLGLSVYEGIRDAGIRFGFSGHAGVKMYLTEHVDTPQLRSWFEQLRQKAAGQQRLPTQ